MQRINYLLLLSLGNETKITKVEVMSSQVQKPFLGGYRNRLTGVEYHNASAQAIEAKIMFNGV